MNENERDDRITIIPDGDVVLVLGCWPYRCSRARRFSFDGTEPVAIELPAEQPSAMIIALRALYGSDPECLAAEPRDIRDVSILADKYDMVARFRPVAAIWLGFPAATTTQPNHQAAWDLLVAAYLFRMDREFFHISQFFIRTDVSVLKYALETHDEHLGLKLGMAIECVRLANFTNHIDIGLCLGCFSTAKESFVERQPGCR